MSALPITKKLLTIDELGEHLKASPKSIYRWVQQGRIPCVKLPRHLRFDLDEVLSHFKHQKRKRSIGAVPLALFFMA